MEELLGLLGFVAIVFVYYWFRRGVSKAIGVGLNKTVLRAGVQKRTAFVNRSVLFQPSNERDPDRIFAAAKNALPSRDPKKLIGASIALRGVHNHLSLVQLTNRVAGKVGEIAISAEEVNNRIVARFTVISWLDSDGDVHSHGHLETLQTDWIEGMKRWDRAGQIIRRDNNSLPTPGEPIRPRTESTTAPDAGTGVPVVDPTSTDKHAGAATPASDETDPQKDQSVAVGMGYQPKRAVAQPVATSTQDDESEPMPDLFCSNCGTRFTEAKKFCTKCGIHR